LSDPDPGVTPDIEIAYCTDNKEPIITAAMNKNRFLIELSESDRTLFGRVEFCDQPESQQVFSAIWEMESQVNNGGFAQYFASADGHTANFAPSALRRIGAHQCADIVRRALLTVSPQALPEDQTARQALIGSVSEDVLTALSQLDEEFFAYPDPLTDLLFQFVSANPREFGAVPVG
jgi:hypothetical protein